jgi:hypothetical protein
VLVPGLLEPWRPAHWGTDVPPDCDVLNLALQSVPANTIQPDLQGAAETNPYLTTTENSQPSYHEPETHGFIALLALRYEFRAQHQFRCQLANHLTT